MEKSQLDSLKETVEGFYASGVMDAVTKQEFDVLFSSFQNLSDKPKELKRISANGY